MRISWVIRVVSAEFERDCTGLAGRTKYNLYYACFRVMHGEGEGEPPFFIQNQRSKTPPLLLPPISNTPLIELLDSCTSSPVFTFSTIFMMPFFITLQLLFPYIIML